MVDTNSEEYLFMLEQMWTLGIDHDQADRAIKATNAASLEAALDYVYEPQETENQIEAQSPKKYYIHSGDSISRKVTRFSTTWSEVNKFSHLKLLTPRKVTPVEGSTASRHVSILSDRTMEVGRVYTITFKWKGALRIKIGVTSSQEHLDYAFSSYQTGWGYFLEQHQTRHSSNDLGTRLGDKYVTDQNNIVTMIFDRIHGSLYFQINAMPEPELAFSDQAFLEHIPFYAAAAIFTTDKSTVNIKSDPWMDRKCLIYVRRHSNIKLLPNGVFRELVGFL